MNKFQKIAIRLAKHEVMATGDDFMLIEYKNHFMKKFKREKWKYPNIIKYKNDYIEWDMNYNWQ